MSNGIVSGKTGMGFDVNEKKIGLYVMRADEKNNDKNQEESNIGNTPQTKFTKILSESLNKT